MKLTVTGTGNYTGETSVIYRILNKGMDISKAKVSAVPKVYTGKEVTLTEDEIVVSLGGAVLNPGTDYEIIPDSYVKNINKGTGKVTIRGIGYYGGVKTISFKIGQRSIIDYWNGIMSFFTAMF